MNFINWSIYFISRIDNTDHIIDVNTNKNNAFDYDQVNIICPKYPEEEPNPEEYIIYNVRVV